MYRRDSRPSSASSVDLAALSSFPLPPYYESSFAATELRQTSPPWTAYRQTLPSPPPRTPTPEDDDSFPHEEYFKATSTPQQRRDEPYGYHDGFDFDDELDLANDCTPALSSSSYSSRSQTSPFPSPTTSSTSSIDSELYNSPGRPKRDVGLGLWLAEQEKKAAQMEKAMSQFSLSSSSSLGSTNSSSYLSRSDDEAPLPRFDPFGRCSPVKVQRASYIKFEPAPAPPIQQRVLRPVAVRPRNLEADFASSPHAHLLPAPTISPPSQLQPSPFSARPSYVAPGPDTPSPSSSVSLTHDDLSRIASQHNGRVPCSEQLAPASHEPTFGLPPPIVNTGNQGKMVVQAGDWRCGTCTFVNWRRRKICMRCFPFASNDIGSSFAARSERAAYLASSASIPSPPLQQQPPSYSIPRSHSLPSNQLLPSFVPRSQSIPTMQQQQHQYSSQSESSYYPLYPSSSFSPVHAGSYASSSHLDHYTQYQRPPFPSRTPTSEEKNRRRIGGLIGYAHGVAY